MLATGLVDCWEIPIFSLPGNFPPAPTTKVLQESAAAGSFKDPAFPPGTSPFHRAHSSKRRTQQQNHPRSRLSLLKWSASRLLGALVRPHTYNQTHHATDATASAPNKCPVVRRHRRSVASSAHGLRIHMSVPNRRGSLPQQVVHE